MHVETAPFIPRVCLRLALRCWFREKVPALGDRNYRSARVYIAAIGKQTSPSLETTDYASKYDCSEDRPHDASL